MSRNSTARLAKLPRQPVPDWWWATRCAKPLAQLARREFLLGGGRVFGLVDAGQPVILVAESEAMAKTLRYASSTRRLAVACFPPGAHLGEVLLRSMYGFARFAAHRDFEWDANLKAGRVYAE